MTRRLLFQTILLLLLLMRPMCYAAQPVFTGLWGSEFEIKSPEAAELHERAWIEFFKGDFPKAIAAADEALTKLGSGSDSTSDRATILATKAEALLNLGRTQDAGQVLQTARDILAGASSSADAARIRLLRDESILALVKGNLPVAGKKLEEAVVKVQVNGLTNRPAYAIVLNSEAGVAVALGRFSDAQRLIEASSLILQKEPSPNWFLEGFNAHNLTQVWIGLGDYAMAARHSERSLERLRRVVSEKHLLYVMVLNSYASILERLGKSELAIPSVQMGLNATMETLGKTNAMVAFSYLTLGNQFSGAGQFPNAISAFNQALSIFRDLLGPESPPVAHAINGIGLVNLKAGRYPEAVRVFTMSAAILLQALGTNDLNGAAVIHNLGVAHRYAGEFKKAEATLRFSIEIQRKGLPDAHPVICHGLRQLGVLAAVQGDFQQAEKWLAMMVGLSRKWLTGQILGISDSDALSALENSKPALELHEAFVSRLGGDSHKQAVGQGAVLLAGSKALLEEALVVRNRMGRESSDGLRARRERLTWLNQQMASLGTLMPASPQHLPMSELQAERDLIENELIQRDWDVARIVQDANASADLISKAVPEGSVLLDFVRYDEIEVGTNDFQWVEPHYAAYATTHDGSRVRIQLGEAKPIDESVAQLHQLLSEKRIAPSRLGPVLSRLGELVYAPLAPHLTNVTHLIICPDGELGRLPFELLPVGNTGRHLIEDKRISYVSSGREVVRLAEPKASVPTNAPVVMGFPDFDLPLAAKSGELASQPVRPDSAAAFVAARTPATLSRDARGQHFDPLPDTEREARSAAKLLGEDCVLRLGADAREAELKRVVSPRILHLATHGYYLTDQEFRATNSLPDLLAGSFGPRFGRRNANEDWENPLIRCGIALAGANHAGSLTNAAAEDGILTGLEASLLNLQGTELVILSACQTGAGDVRIGEGVMSLRRAFTIAGAQSVLASHWRVSDEATSRLITEFLRHWRAGKPRVEALREAQLSLLRSKEFASPFYWAAFTLTGRWD